MFRIHWSTDKDHFDYQKHTLNVFKTIFDLSLALLLSIRPYLTQCKDQIRELAIQCWCCVNADYFVRALA